MDKINAAKLSAGQTCRVCRQMCHLHAVLCALDFQVQNLHGEHPNLIFYQQLMELTEVAEHKPD